MKFFIIFFSIILCKIVKAQEITVFYYERPPFYYTNESGKASGILVDKVRKIKSKKYPIIFKVYPPKRQLLAIAAKEKNICGLGWFKTIDREKIGIFSTGIFTDEPLGLMIHKDFGNLKNISVQTIFKNKSFEFIKKNSFKYSDNIEVLEAELKPTTYTVSSSIATMLEMIGVRQRYYTFIDRVEANYIFKTKPSLRNSIIFIPTDEGKKGNSRHLYCSKNIPEDFSKLIKSFSF